MKRKSLILIGVLSFFSLFLITSLSLGLYFTSQPRFCQSCHVMRKDYQAWRESSHKEVHCYRCHTVQGRISLAIQKLKEFGEMVSYPLGFYEKPILSEVKNSACLVCHRKVKKGVLLKNDIRISHKEFLKTGSWCTDCHNTIAHGKAVPVKRYPTVDKCMECHNGEKASAKCVTCHLKDVSEKKGHPLPEIMAQNGELSTHGDMEIWGHLHGKTALKGLSNCNLCHVKSTCLECHQIEMPHPADFMPNHALKAQGDGIKRCLNCHWQEDCNRCHARHIHPPVNCGECHAT